MQKLFSEFKPTTADDWKKQIIKDLKGEPFDNLVWKNENGFEIQPFYTAEDLKQVYEPAFIHANWDICVRGKGSDANAMNSQLLRQLNSGATSISLHCNDLDLEKALKDVQLDYIHSSFFVAEKGLNVLERYLKANYDLKDLHCTLFPENLNNALSLEKWLTYSEEFRKYPHIKTCSFDALYYHNQNCLAYYEVAIILSALNEYLNQLSQKNTFPSAPFVIKTGVNSDYFIQIAKLRAIRRLWNLLRAEYNITNELYVIVETGLTNKSISDAYNNLLRTTVESMAAVSGGCNELIVEEFDALFTVNKTLSERMAINQQLILKDESYLDKMADIACGSYYIESITDALAEKALETMKFFEAGGGYFKCLEDNVFSKEIALQAKRKADQVGLQHQIVIGVNKYRNEKEFIKLPPGKRDVLEHLSIHNPVLNYELEHYFK